jgi:hypothetical protein
MLMVQPTPCPDVNDVLSQILRSAPGILGDQFVGLPLYGSLALGVSTRKEAI